MPFLRIHCDYCGGMWDVYRKMRWIDTAARCPHCDARIDGTTWAKILQAYDNMQAVNKELLDDHVTRHLPKFEVDYINDGTFKNASHTDLSVELLNDGIDDLREELANLRADVTRLGATITKEGKT